MPKIGPNKSKYHGIYKHQGMWIAKVTINGKQTEVGKSVFEDEAARIYNAAIIHYGLSNKYLNTVPDRTELELTPDDITYILGQK
jgi:hypothetical protein